MMQSRSGLGIELDLELERLRNGYNDIPLKEKRKIFKKELESIFGKGKVLVQGDRGTASHWTRVLVITEREDAREIINGLEDKYNFPVYLQDDGWSDSYSTCVLIDISKE